MNTFLLNSNISQCLDINDVETVWSIIKTLVYKAMAINIPKFKLRAHQYPKWFTPPLRHQLKCLHTLRKTCKRSPTPSNLERLDHAETEFQQNIIRAKSSYEADLIFNYADRSVSKIYNYIRSITKTETIPTVLNLDSATVTTDADKAALFNQYFHSVFTTSSSTLPDMGYPSIDSLQLIDISETEVYNALISLDPNKALGIDGIGPKILKNCSESLFQPLCHLFNLSLSSSIIPIEWKIHRIIPIFKSGDRSSISNYRPISLLCNVSKVLEHIISNKIINHITTMISPNQFGFLQHRSTTQQLILFLSDIHNAMSNGHQADVIYLDFKKAFDSVPHTNLLIKLWTFRITGCLWEWFKSYLTNRQQCVCINDSTSKTLPVLSGVPQGSVLGPILFLIYVNDLPATVTNTKLLLFADDAKLYKSIANPTDVLLLQEDLNLLNSWSINNLLNFNVNKCIFLSFNAKSLSNYHIGTKQLSQSDSHRDLGVLQSSNLSWSQHYNHILANAYKSFNLLRRTLSKHHSIQTKKKLYISLVRSRLIYSSQLWNPYLIKDIVILERIQRRATKFILNDYSSNYKSRLLNLNILPLMYQFDYYDILFFIKHIKYPTDNFNIFNHVTFSHGSTRSSSHSKLHHKYSASNLLRNSYFCRLPKIWNSLPPIDLNQSFTSIRSFVIGTFWDHFTANFDPENPCTFHFTCLCRNCYCSSLAVNFS